MYWSLKVKLKRDIQSAQRDKKRYEEFSNPKTRITMTSDN